MTARSFPHGPSRRRLAGAVLPLALLASGCATGSSASFTMAPLFFSEAADPSGEIVPDNAPADNGTAFAPGVPSGSIAVRYIAASGNAVLPVNAIADGSALPIAALNTAGLASSAALAALPGAVGGLTGALGPVGLDRTLAGTVATLDSGLATATGANTAALNGVVGATGSAVTTVTTTAIAAVPAVTMVATAPVTAAVAAAAPAALIPTAANMLVTAQPLIPAVTAAAPAAPPGMLASSVTSLVQICLMSRCK